MGMKTGAKPTPIEVRFWRHVSPCPNTGCWWWLGAVQRKGYGHIGRGGRGAGNVICSRLSYEMHHGVAPGEMFVCHSCDNPLCVNPEHLFLGTNTDNMRDCSAKGRISRGPGFRGEGHFAAKLTEEAVRSIRASGELGVVLARRYGVYPTLISMVRNRKIWTHVE